MSTAILTFQVSPGNDIEFPLDADSVTLGRDPSNTIVIQNSWISTKHALIARRESGDFEILDLGSHNGVEVNGEPVVRCLLQDGDKISFGQIEARFHNPKPAANRGIPSSVPHPPPPRGGHDGLEKELESLRSEHRSLSAEVETLRKVNAQLSEAAQTEGTIRKLQKKLDALHEEIAQAVVTRDELVGESDETRRSLEAYETEAVRCRNEIASARNALAELENSKAPATAALATEHVKLASIRAAVAAAETGRSALEKEHDDLATRTLKVQETLASLTEEVRKKGEENAVAEAERASHRSLVAETRSRLASLQSSRKEAETELARQQTALRQLRTDFESLRGSRDSAQSACNELKSATKALELRVADLQEQKNTLEAAQNLEWGTVHVFSKFLIRRIDLLDDLLNNVIASSEDPALVDQLIALRESLLDILREHSVEPFHFPEGTRIDISTRKRILIIGGIGESAHSPNDGKEIAATIRPGYFCSNGDLGNEILLRKAEVKIA